MKQKIHLILGGLLVVAACALFVAQPVSAVDVFGGCDEVNSSDPVCESQGDEVDTLIGNIITALLGLIGIVSVIFLIIGGFRYITAQGDSSQIASAKNTILYAIIGLVVALASYAIVAFVLTNV